MTRAAPKFAVGDEVVVIESGIVLREGRIDDMKWLDDFFFVQGPYTGWGYLIAGRGSIERLVHRKRPDHAAADQSFDQLMQGLKRLQGVEA